MKKADGRVSSLDLLIKRDPPMGQHAGPEPAAGRRPGRGNRKYLLLLLLALLVWTGVFVYIRGTGPVSPDTGHHAGGQITHGSDANTDDVEGRNGGDHKKHGAATPHVKVRETKAHGGTQVILHDKDGDSSGRKGPVNLGTSIELITD